MDKEMIRLFRRLDAERTSTNNDSSTFAQVVLGQDFPHTRPAVHRKPTARGGALDFQMSGLTMAGVVTQLFHLRKDLTEKQPFGFGYQTRQSWLEVRIRYAEII